MNNKNLAWQWLIDVAFNNKKEVPIELLANFRNLATVHNLDYYCDYLRGNMFPEKLKEDPWEWKFLEKLSNLLPNDIEVLVLKGAAARDMELYKLPLLRKSVDLDIYVPGINNYEKQIELVEDLIKRINIRLVSTWKKDLNKQKTFVALVDNHDIDIHFNIFYHGEYKTNLLTNPSTYYEKLLKGVMERAIPYQNLKNIKKLNVEDFWFYTIFHFLKHFPFVNLASILDSFLVLKENKTTLEKLKQHAINTDQLYIYNLGVYLLSQLSNEIKELPKINSIDKKLFKIERIIEPWGYGIVNHFLAIYTKEAIATKGNIILGSFSAVLYLLINKLIKISFDEEGISIRGFLNLITKIQYTYTKLINFLKRFCLRLARVGSKKEETSLQIQPSEKELISIKLDNLQLTFKVPEEFIGSLKKVWKGFITDDHLNEHITVEKILNNIETEAEIQMTISKNKAYLKSYNGSYGTATLDSLGTFFACQFWDVRTFANFLFRAMTLKRNNLFLVHAGGVKIGDNGFIFPGESSAGKSTFFKLLTKNDFLGINDDTILLKKEDNTWYMHPTPFMSKKIEPTVCEKVKLTGIIDLVKVCGGYEITPQDINHSLAILFNNSMCDVTIDDAGFIEKETSQKILELSNQIKYSSQIKFSLDNEEILLKLINNWLDLPKESHKYGSKITNLVEFRGSSMEPTLKHGDILKVEEIPPGNLKSKDIIGFKYSSVSLPIIHRIKYIIKHKSQTTIITKGDNCLFEDTPYVFKSNQKILKVINKLVSTYRLF